MKYTKERIDATDTHTFTAQPSEGILTLMKSIDGKKPVESFDHGWWASRGYQDVADMNATYFWGSGVVGGMIVDSGIEVSPFLADKKFITLIYKNGELILDEEYRANTLKAKYAGYNFIVQLGDPLVKDGVDYEGDGQFDHTNSRHPRSFIGQKKSGEIVFFATDGRSASDRGFTRDELSLIALDMDCQVAVMCDGGGSSTLVIEDEMVNNNENRIVPSVFMFYAKGYVLDREVIGEKDSIFAKANETPECFDDYDGFLKSKITPNFKFYELACNANDEIYMDKAVWNHAWRLQETRKRMTGRLGYVLSFVVNSWFRTVVYNSSLKGSSATSLHLKGIATDLKIRQSWIQDLLMKTWFEVCEEDGLQGGCGRYTTFLHVDSRKYRSVWDKR